ncbi:MAG TPA: winged helix DNA-binding protein [Allosphingosinicella sp.]|nr:winged helix DNA-binding protein [Allosphingosinicella sp.]
MTRSEGRPQDAAAQGYQGGSAVLVAAHGRVEPWARATAMAGCRLLAVIPPAASPDALDTAPCGNAILLDEAGADEERLQAWIARIRRDAELGRRGAVVSTSLASLDRMAAGLLDPAVEPLCDPSDEDRAVAIRHATAPRSARLHDVNKGQGTARLQQLSEEVGRIASVLAALSEDEAAAAAVAAATGPEAAGEKIDAGFIRSIIRARRLRDHFFRSELFADPAWDMILDLMAARVEKQRVAVSSLCIAAAVPPTTALRWIKTLCDQGVFVRMSDPEDGRRVFIELSEDAAVSMEAYLKSARRIATLNV